MAEINARIKVTADVSEAKKSVDKLSSEVKRMKEAEKRAQAAAPGDGLPTSREEAQRMIADGYRERFVSYKGEYRKKQSNTPDEDPRRIGREIAEAFSRVAGSAMAKFVVGYLSNQGVGTAFELMRRPGRDNSRIDQVESTLQGAIQWGASGAQIAGPKGAIVGAAFGGLQSFIMREKQIRDAIKEANQNYNLERKSSRWESGRRMSDRAFEGILNGMTPGERGIAIHGRMEEMTGGGVNGRQFWKRYEEAKKNDADAYAEMWHQMSEALDAELHNNGRDASGKIVSIAGNDAGTRNFYEILTRFAQEEFGKDDKKRTQQIMERRASMNARIDAAKESEFGTYMGELERMRSVASGMTAITDSASAKGLGVGAQIGAMNNERLLRGIDRVIRAINLSGEKSVDAIRANGGALETVARAM
ncbi:MAG: hypothetical protein IIZ06_03790 [Kiritimatiellae bacterium]|nr:hypothetical protein [Kiritimatiellia bacterium]